MCMLVDLCKNHKVVGDKWVSKKKRQNIECGERKIQVETGGEIFYTSGGKNIDFSCLLLQFGWHNWTLKDTTTWQLIGG